MRVIKVLDTVKLQDNTVVFVEDRYNCLRSGMGVIDGNGNNHVILSVGTFNPMDHLEKITSLDKTNILIKGDFNSNKIIVY